MSKGMIFLLACILFALLGWWDLLAVIAFLGTILWLGKVWLKLPGQNDDTW